MRLLLAAVAFVVAAAAVATAAIVRCAATTPEAWRARGDAAPVDAAPADLPDVAAPRCGPQVVDMVRAHGSTEPGLTIEALAKRRLEEKAQRESVELVIHGWRGLEDREKSAYCRVSFRYQLGEERGAEVWLVDPEAPAHARLEPQGLLSVEATEVEPWPGQAEIQKKCVDDGIERVKRHFSYMENYSLWRCLRKRAMEIRAEGGPEIVYNAWHAKAEGPERCLVWVDYTEDGAKQNAYFRLRYVPGEEHAIEPLTPRAIEALYGPGVFSR